MAREPGSGELLGRLDDLEREVSSLRTALAVALLCGILLWLDIRQAKEAKHVD